MKALAKSTSNLIAGRIAPRSNHFSTRKQQKGEEQAVSGASQRSPPFEERTANASNFDGKQGSAKTEDVVKLNKEHFDVLIKQLEKLEKENKNQRNKDLKMLIFVSLAGILLAKSFYDAFNRGMKNPDSLLYRKLVKQVVERQLASQEEVCPVDIENATPAPEEAPKAKIQESKATEAAKDDKISKREQAKLELIKRVNESITKLLSDNEKVKLIHNLSEFNTILATTQEPSAVLAVPVFLQEEQIKSATDFLSNLSDFIDSKINVYLKPIATQDDFSDVNSITKSKFLGEDQSFKTVGVFNPNLGRWVSYSLQDLKYDSKKILSSFAGVKTVKTAEDWQKLLASQSKDELLFAFCEGDHRAKFNELLFGAENVNMDKVVPVIVDPTNEFLACKKNEVIAVIKDGGASDIKIGRKNWTAKRLSIDGQQSISEIYTKVADMLNESTGFSNTWIPDHKRRFQVIFTVNKNFVTKQKLKSLENMIKEVRSGLKESANQFDFNIHYRLLSPNIEASEITAVDMDRSKRQHFLRYDNKDPAVFKDPASESPALLSQFNSEYKFEGQSIDKTSLIKFCTDLLEGKANFEIKSEKEPIADYYSRKIVGKEFKQRILESPYNQIIFYYSHHCGGCKKFLPMYEELAYENLKNEKSLLTFNRIDNEKNQNADQEVYLSTPKIIMYRSDLRRQPFEYRSDKLNKSLLKGFINATLGFEPTVDSKLLDQAVQAVTETMESGLFSKLS